MTSECHFHVDLFARLRFAPATQFAVIVVDVVFLVFPARARALFVISVITARPSNIISGNRRIVIESSRYLRHIIFDKHHARRSNARRITTCARRPVLRFLEDP